LADLLEGGFERENATGPAFAAAAGELDATWQSGTEKSFGFRTIRG